jgi:CheY-like chemotaxis protein
VLRQLSFEVEEAASGEEALQRIQGSDDARQPFDLVFLDWKMPGLGGLAVAEQLGRRAEARAALRAGGGRQQRGHPWRPSVPASTP